MSRNAARPLSPHLSIWKWGPHMLVSILHRATGTAMAIGGGLIFTWWLVAAAMSGAAYDIFYHWIVASDPSSAHEGAQALVNILAKLVGIGLTWSFFQHMASGIRHFVLDTGAGYELKTNRMGAILTIVFALVATLVLWTILLLGKLN
ncbi:succinate dehydrogenase, cytochrome b556 subunit [Sphingomonas abietis]|uniref:Succinate dehydrogenase cytochrome b556 subunit n=1 Tax=Sphingomonas abietis TaxID=3012344 RepID=A0ABY7NPS1_9SPHN|nr:succinate dehydrogenase, cytochrome b556 subunit [Sphingomonas abietis]WBO23539.1 succinate dehydrogenase, cytochrome b556 subunit [Sphingomonas abietis]